MSSPTPNEVDREHAAKLVKTISTDKDFHDVQFVAELDGKKFPVHRVVMVSSSDYFRALLGRNFKEGEQNEVTITGVDGPTLQLIIDFCYSGYIRINEENLHQILDAASPMGLVDVERKCERFMIDNLRTSNCLDLFLVAEKYSLCDLRKESLDFICKSFEALSVSELCEMPLAFIIDLLKSDQIHAREDLIFHRLNDWIAADENVRAKSARELLKLIHMDKLTLSVFVEDFSVFTEKFGSMDLVFNALQRRAKSDEMSTNIFRCEAENTKKMFAVSYEYINDNDDIIRMINIEKYNPIADRWSLHRNIPITNPNIAPSSQSCASLFINDKIFLIGGFRNGKYTQQIDTYLLETSQLSAIDAKLKTEKGYVSPVLYKGQIFIFGGYVGQRSMATCESLSLETMSTEQVGSMEISRNICAAAALNDRIYVVGGEGNVDENVNCVDDVDGNILMRSSECYDTESKKWTRIADMIHPRSGFAVVAWNEMLYAMGFHSSVERYDPTQNSWTEIGSFDGSDKVIRAVNWQNEIYVIMNDGRFGKVTVEPVCKFHSLRGLPCSDYFGKYLFIN